MQNLPTILSALSMAEAAGLFLVENIVVFLMAIATGALLQRIFPNHRVAPVPEPIERAEIQLTIMTILLNTAITFAGWMMWRRRIITFRSDVGFRALVVDVMVLFLVMDGAMYITHRVGHWHRIFSFVHRTHHRYSNPRPLTLFVLSPFETASFGALWLLISSLYDSSWIGMMIYLTLNVLFGVIGHLGVEPFPRSWKRIPLLRYISTSSFHAQHHNDLEHNYGFYTLIWDKVFGTLSPRYDSDFGRLPSTEEPVEAST